MASVRLWVKLVALLTPMAVITSCAARSPQTISPVKRASAPASNGSGLKVADARFKTRDGLRLRGRLYGKGNATTGVILSHMYPADQNSWTEFARYLADKGYLVLTFDFRGYGFSQGRKDIPKLDRDIEGAVRFMEARTEDIFVIGASMGGTAALRAASRRRVAGVATLSSPREFLGLSAGPDLGRKAKAKLFIATAEDGSAPEAARSFYEAASEPRELEIVKGGAHGTDMLRAGDNGVRDILATWLAKSRATR